MNRYTWLAALAVSAMAAACGGGVGSGGTGGPVGTVSISLTDNPCDFRNVFVTVDRLRVHASENASDTDDGWRDVPLSLSPAQRRVDLLQLQNGVFLKLGDVQLPAGRYTQLRLVLADNAGGGTPANAVVLADGTTVPLTTPSAQRSGLKLIRPFDVVADQTLELLLDFDACRSVVRNGASGRYTLKPTIAVVPLVDVGRIRGAVTPGALVSAQVVAPGAAPTVVKSTRAAADGTFALSPLPAAGAGARYTLVVTAPGAATAVVREVPVVRQTDTILSTVSVPVPTVLSPSSTLAGRISPVGLDDALVRALQTVDGVSVEIASAPPDAVDGTYSLQVPRGAVRLSNYPTVAPFPPTSTLAFSAAVGQPGRYTVQAGAAGRAPAGTAVLDASAGNVTVPVLSPIAP